MIVRESMTRIERDGYVVRIWRNENPQSPLMQTTQLKSSVLDILDAHPHRQTFKSVIANKILKLPDVAAVEIIDGRGDGEVWYADWP